MSCGKGNRAPKGTISRRLTQTYAAFFVATLFVLSVTLFVTLSTFMVNRQRDTLRNTANLLVDQILEEVGEEEPLEMLELMNGFNETWNMNILYFDASGQLVHGMRNFHMDETNLPFARGRARLSVQKGMQMVLCLSQPVGDEGKDYGSVYLALSLHTEQEFLQILAILLVVTNLVGFVAALAVGWATSRRLLSPIDRMIADADRINSQRLNRRLDVPETRDELQKLSLTINSMLDRVEEAFRQQGRFTADASHELRTPLAILQGNADLLERWGRDDPAVLNESIASIQRQTAYMKKLVENLLFLTRGDGGTQHLTRENFDLSALLRELGEEQGAIDDAHRYGVEAPAGLMLYADRAMIRQFLYTLIDNSIKYTPAGGQITLTGQTTEGGISIAVTDTGMGMEPEHTAHIFERFYRVDQARARATGGMGLGLAIAKAIVDVHGGTLTATSEEGKGTTICAVFPR